MPISYKEILDAAKRGDKVKMKHKGMKGSNTPEETQDFVQDLGDLGDSGPATGELPSGGGYGAGDGGAGPGGAAASILARINRVRREDQILARLKK